MAPVGFWWVYGKNVWGGRIWFEFKGLKQYYCFMPNQEKQIINLLLNELAFEGARLHFLESDPTINIMHFTAINGIGLPQRMQRGQYSPNNNLQGLNANQQLSEYEKCYRCMRQIRNNIIHANKAMVPDTPNRLSDLLNWSDSFICSGSDLI